MAAIFGLPRVTLFDTNGLVIPGGRLRFYDAGTTTPQTVYSDAGLSSAISQPVTADAAGRFVAIFLSPGSYKVRVYDADDTLIYEEDDLVALATDDPLPVANGGTGSATAANARTALGAASQADLDTFSTDLTSAQADITSLQGSVAALSGQSVVKRTLLQSTASVVTCSTHVPYDDSIPQNTEGSQVLTGSYTPFSASSALEVEAIVQGSPATADTVAIALFKDTGADAIAARWAYGAASVMTLGLKHRMSSWGTSAATLAVRVGGASYTFYANGNISGTRVGGGIQLCSLYVTEYIPVP